MDSVSSGKIGKYEIIKVLGRGGMGEVLLAMDEDLGRRVAIKRPFKSAQDDGLARFQVEAKAATLRHPNIPTVYEMGVQDGLPYIAMEFVEGEALDKIIATNRPLDLISKLKIIEQVCSALGYAHENGIIHRDIKPANVIVQPDGTAKIIDFGIAKIQDSSGKAGLTQTSAVIGSLHYIAPERFKGGPIDGRVDIFSAGVTLYKLLTGQEPFTGGEATASYKIVNEAHTSLSAYLHDYPPVLDEIIAKSLAKNPEDRYYSGEDFADALHDVIEDLKRSRITELFNDAERLTTEKRFTPALELLDEAAKLDPANTQVRKLRRFVKEHQDRLRRAERLRECTTRADQALLAGNFEEAINQLKEAQNLDSTNTEIRQRIQTVEETMRRHEMSSRALIEAEAAKNRGDVTAAMRILVKALEVDPENHKLLAANSALARQLEAEKQRGRILEIIEQAHKALAAQNLDAVEQLLGEAHSLDPGNLETEKLRWELNQARDLQKRRAVLDEIQSRVNEFLRTEAFQQAADLLNRAIEKLPNEAMLHRLKAEVDAEARKFDTRRFVDGAITEAQNLFQNDPQAALAVLQRALDQMPGEERLVAFERSLRLQMDTRRMEQLHAETLLKARELLAAKDFVKAVGILETFQIDYGHHADIDDLLAFARDEQSKLERGALIDRCAAEGRALFKEGRLDEAVRVLENGLRETKAPALAQLLEEVKAEQAALARKLDALHKRIAQFRERGEFAPAIELLQQQLASTPGNPQLQDLLASLTAEQQQQQATRKAIEAASAASQRKEFAAGLDALRAVLAAYGESAELTRATQQMEGERTAHAQDVVGKSIDAARTALLANDPQTALASLKNATPWLEFADSRKQADWQRIGQSVKKALEQSGAASTTGGFDKQLAEIAAAKPRKFPVALVAVGAVVLLAIVGFVVWRMLQPAAPPAPTFAQIKISKAPAGATISIDGKVAGQADANGDITLQVAPGSRKLLVAEDGYESFPDGFDLKAGEIALEKVPALTKLLPAGTSGTLVINGNLPRFKLYVDGAFRGQRQAGDSVVLAQGARKVRYATLDDSDSVEHSIQIAANQNLTDSFTLKPPAPKPQAATQQAANNPPVQVQPPPAQVQQPTPQPAAQPTGTLTVSSSSVERGQSLTLSWQVSNASSVSITDLGPVAPQGSRTITPAKATKFELVANGGTVLAEQYVDLREPKPQPVAVAQPPAVTQKPQAQPAGPERAALEPALSAYRSVFTRASGKSAKDCQGVFNGAYGGLLKSWARWCDPAKKFEVADQCGSVGGSPDAPTLACSESITLYLKDGDPQQSSTHKVFRFTRSSDGSWQLAGW